MTLRCGDTMDFRDTMYKKYFVGKDCFAVTLVKPKLETNTAKIVVSYVDVRTGTLRGRKRVPQELIDAILADKDFEVGWENLCVKPSRR